MDRIVVGLDESAAAADALRWAVHEGTVHDARVAAVMAWGYLDQHHITAEHAFDPDYDEAAAGAVLDELIARALRPAGGSVRGTVRCDLPARAVGEAASGADLLVVGARGLGGFRGLLLGSISRHCLHHATCPVAVIREADHSPGRVTDRVVVGIDGSETSAKALAWAVREARARRSPLVVVHSYRNAILGAIEYSAPVLSPDMLEQAARDSVQRALADVDTGGLVTAPQRIIVESGAPAAILDAASDASVVVVGSRGMGGVKGFVLGSVSHQVTQHAPCPVVVIPPADRAAPETPAT